MHCEEWITTKSKLSNIVFKNVSKASEKFKQLALSVIELEIKEALGKKNL